MNESTANFLTSAITQTSTLEHELDAIQARRDYCEDMAQRIADYKDTYHRLKRRNKRASLYGNYPIANRENLDAGGYSYQLRDYALAYAYAEINNAKHRARVMGLYVTHWTQLCI